MKTVFFPAKPKLLLLLLVLFSALAHAQDLYPGCILTPVQYVEINTPAPYLTATAATGGSCSGNYHYQWQLSTDNHYFTDIPEATGTSLNYTQPITVTTYFQRLIVCGNAVMATNVASVVPMSQMYHSAAKSATFTRNNCSLGSTGSSVVYTVAAGAYTSLFSQADADNKAQQEVDANGQAYANTNGSCSDPVLYYNEAFDFKYNKPGCGVGYRGAYYSASVPYGMFSSTVSVEDANQAAWDYWVSAANNYWTLYPQGCIKLIYAELLIDNIHDDDAGFEVGDLYVALYEDEAGTIPLSEIPDSPPPYVWAITDTYSTIDDEWLYRRVGAIGNWVTESYQFVETIPLKDYFSQLRYEYRLYEGPDYYYLPVAR